MPKPRSDPALKWLFQNDPEAMGKSQNGYMRDAGIVGATHQGEINKRECVEYNDEADYPHCAQCVERSHARLRMAE